MSQRTKNQQKHSGGHHAGNAQHLATQRPAEPPPPAEKRPVREAYRRGGLAVQLVIIAGLILAATGILGLFAGWFIWLWTGLIMGGLCLLAAAVARVEYIRRND